MSRFLTIAAAALLLAYSPIDAFARDSGVGGGWVTTTEGVEAVGHIFYPNSGIRTIDPASPARTHFSIHRHRVALNAGKHAVHVDTPIVSETSPPLNQTSTPAPSPSLPSPARGCSETGSCYGDISNITGLPKTTYVNGYYRRDGTYVGSYYRSHHSSVRCWWAWG